MNEGFSCETVGSLVIVRITRALTDRVLDGCQRCVVEALHEAGSRAVLYDLTGIEPTPIDVLLYRRLLRDHAPRLEIRRAIVVPNTQTAHFARLAFGGDDYRLFYDDVEAAKRFLRDASPFSGADWGVGVLEERRLRERRSAARSRGGRRDRDRVVG